MQGESTKTALKTVGLLASVLLTSLVASATPPVKSSYQFTASGYLIGVAYFDIIVDSVVTINQIDFFDDSGRLVRTFQNVVEQDTFTANFKTLVSDPFKFNVQMEFDSSGNVTRFDSSGVAERVPLPDGTVFISAGLTDWLNHSGEAWVLKPDDGACVNLAGFIAALSP